MKMLKPTSVRDIINQTKLGIQLCDIQKEACIAYIHGCHGITKINLSKSIEAFQKLFILSRLLGDPEGEKTALMKLSYCTFMNRQFDDSINFSNMLIDLSSGSNSGQLSQICLQYNITMASLQKELAKKQEENQLTKVSNFVQGLMLLSDSFDQVGPNGKVYSVLCQAHIEILKLLKTGDLSDLNSASEGIQEIISQIQKTLAEKSPTLKITMDKITFQNQTQYSP